MDFAGLFRHSSHDEKYMVCFKNLTESPIASKTEKHFGGGHIVILRRTDPLIYTPKYTVMNDKVP